MIEYPMILLFKRFFCGFVHSKRATQYVWLLLLVNGCASTAPLIAPSAVDVFRGKMAINPREGKAHTVSFQWQHTSTMDTISVSTMFGIPVFTLIRDPYISTLTMANGDQYHADNPETLMQSLVGWSLPTAAITQWMHGQLNGSEHNPRKNQLGQWQSFNYQQWHIELSRHTTAYPDARPQLIMLTSEELRMKMIIKAYERLD